MQIPLRVLVSLVAAAGPVSSASAQSINFDCGTFNASPSNTYGAASGQTGHWNNVSVIGSVPLLDTTGSATAVSVNTTGAGNFGFGFDNLLTNGDDALLLDAGHDGALTMDFSG